MGILLPIICMQSEYVETSQAVKWWDLEGNLGWVSLDIRGIKMN